MSASAKSRQRQRRRFAAAAVAALALGVVPPATAQADHTITLTFVRHAESQANAAMVIDTSVPGPPLSDVGFDRANALADQLSANGYDAIYASDMIRAQQTAAPLAVATDERVNILPGLNEIPAGSYEGKPLSEVNGYLEAPRAWIDGDLSVQMPGSISGAEFDARFDEAVRSIFADGYTHPVAFSHSVATMAWVLINVKNPDKSLFDDPGMPNTGQIVVVGSPRQGWALTSWNGVPVSQ